MSHVFGREAFGRGSGHEGGALINEIDALIKETPESCHAPLLLLPVEEHRVKTVL